MQSHARIAVWGVVAVAALAAAYGLAVVWPSQHVENRVYRIGWQDAPPFQRKGPNGPTGVAIDLVREGARRRQVRLEWVWAPESSDKALRAHKVDLWPLVTVTPERRREFHLTQPYMQHETDLVVLARSPYTQAKDLASATIAHLDLPIMHVLLRNVLPNAKGVEKATHKAAVEEVCANRVDAAFLDDFSATSVLLSGFSCSGQPLRVIPLPLRIELAVGSTPQAAAAADAIRDGISDAARDGALERILANWNTFSPWSMNYVSALLAAQRRERWLILAVAVFAALFALAVLGAYRIRRQKDRIAQAEEALRKNEQNLSLMAANLKEMVLAYDMERKLTFANPAVQELTGYAPSELEGQSALRWIQTDDQVRMQAYWDQMFNGGANRNEEYRLITKDGRLKWVSATWGPIFDGGGRQVGVQRSERDITERKQAEDALRESERRLRELLESVQLVAVMINRNGYISFCNDYALAITGWTLDEVVGHPAGNLLDGSYLGQLTQWMEGAAASGVLEPHMESGILTKDGGTRRIQWSSAALRDPQGRVVGLAILGADVTELESLRADAARRESEARFRHAVDASPVMIWISGTDKLCTFFNKGWLAFTGRSMEQELGEGWTEGVHPDDLERCMTMYVRSFDRRVPFQMEYRLRRADGEFRWVFDSGVPRFEPDGAFAGYVGSCTDITDLKHAQAEDLARQKLESVGRLAAGIAHDFNNLLGGVVAHAEAALSDLHSNVTPEAELNRIRAVAIRGAGIVRQLMIYAGQENPEPELVDISRVAAEMVELLRVAVSKHATLQASLASDLPPVRANPAQLQQLVMNLVSNASEAIGERDGVVRIETSRAGDGAVQLQISDTGCGMGTEAQARVFDPFFTTKSQGHGLGLAVVQGIVRALDGKIVLASIPGKGTTVRVVLPSVAGAPRRPRRPAPGPAEEAPRLAARTILLVEDEDALRIPVSKMLRNRGWSVLEAPDGSAAMEVIRGHGVPISVILLDMTLPGTPSRMVFEEARRRRPDTKVIITSAFGQSLVDATFPGVQVDAFIRKPYRLQELTGLLAEVLAPSRVGMGQSPS